VKKVVFILFLLVGVLFSREVSEAATLRLSPATGSFILGSTFDISVVLNTQGESVNTVEVELNFPPDKLQLADPSLGKSIVEIWASPPIFSNREGRIYFVGGIPSPGVNTSEGIAQSFTFRVVSPGAARITFGENTSVLANDGKGTNILRQTSPGSFRLILPPAQGPDVFSPTHPEQGRWYKDPNPIFKWTSIKQSQGASYSIDHDPVSAPDTSVDTVDDEATFSDLDSGIWYFHVREKAGSSWSGVSHYFLNIDTVPPAAFGIKVSPGERTSNRSPILRFFTTDSLSGFDHFEMKIVPLKSGPNESTFFFEASNPHQISELEPGRYEVVIRAYDKAGNFRDESVTISILSSFFQFLSPEGVDFYIFFAPWGLFLPILLFTTLAVLIYMIFIWRRHKHHLRPIIRHDLGELSFLRKSSKRKRK